MNKEYNHCLIVASVNQGYSNSLVETANLAGARGGTVLQAKNIEYGESNETLQHEQEVILMLVKKEFELDIVNAVNENFGFNSEAHGTILSLPVDNVVGLFE